MSYYVEIDHGHLPTTYSSLMNIFVSSSTAKTSAVETAVFNNPWRNIGNISGHTVTFTYNLLAKQGIGSQNSSWIFPSVTVNGSREPSTRGYEATRERISLIAIYWRGRKYKGVRLYVFCMTSRCSAQIDTVTTEFTFRNQRFKNQCQKLRVVAEIPGCAPCKRMLPMHCSGVYIPHWQWKSFHAHTSMITETSALWKVHHIPRNYCQQELVKYIKCSK